MEFGFTFSEEYVSRTAQMLKLSNFQCWPELGGWAVQDDLLVQDVMIWLSLERRMEWEVETGFEEDRDSSANDAFVITTDQMG